MSRVAALGGGLAGDPVGGEAARRVARAELRRSEYRSAGPGLLDRVWNWFGDRLVSLTGGTGGGALVVLVLAVVLAAVVVFAVRAGTPRRLARAASGTDDPLAPSAAHDHRAVARRYTTEGRRAEALREWLRAAVQTIETRGVLPPRPGRTGRAAAREAGPLLPGAAADLGAATAAFDEVWFGGRAATDGDVERARAAADAVARGRIVTSAAAAPDGMAAPW